jgi:NAD(P)H-flavin reductase
MSIFRIILKIKANISGQISRGPDDIFHNSDLQTLAENHTNIRYFPCVSLHDVSLKEDIFQEGASELAFVDNPKLTSSSIYFCGSLSMVDKGNDQVLKNGTSLRKLLAYLFVIKDPPAQFRQT